MVSSYALGQKKKVRVTLELNVFQDFDAKQIDFEKLFELEPAESVEVYVEDFSENPWWSYNPSPELATIPYNTPETFETTLYKS